MIAMVSWIALDRLAARVSSEQRFMQIHLVRTGLDTWIPWDRTQAGDRMFVQLLVMDIKGIGWAEMRVHPVISGVPTQTRTVTAARVLQVWEADIASGGGHTVIVGSMISVERQRSLVAMLAKNKAAAQPAIPATMSSLYVADVEGRTWRYILRALPTAAFVVIAAGIALQGFQTLRRARNAWRSRLRAQTV